MLLGEKIVSEFLFVTKSACLDFLQLKEYWVESKLVDLALSVVIWVVELRMVVVSKLFNLVIDNYLEVYQLKQVFLNTLNKFFLVFEIDTDFRG